MKYSSRNNSILTTKKYGQLDEKDANTVPSSPLKKKFRHLF